MGILSVPLSSQLSKKVDTLVKEGIAPNKATLARKALEYYTEALAVQAVLAAEQEVAEGKILRGDLKTLAKSL